MRTCATCAHGKDSGWGFINCNFPLPPWIEAVLNLTTNKRNAAEMPHNYNMCTVWKANEVSAAKPQQDPSPSNPPRPYDR